MSTKPTAHQPGAAFPPIPQSVGRLHYHIHYPRPLHDPQIAALATRFAGFEDRLSAAVDVLGTVALRQEAMAATLGMMLRRLNTIIRKENAEMAKFADLQAATDANTAASKAMLVVLAEQHTKMGEMAKQLQDALDNGSDAEIQGVVDALTANRADMLAAIQAVQTPAGDPVPEPTPVPAPAPTPDPVPVDPAPEPAPVDPGPEPAPIDPGVEPAPAPADGPLPQGRKG